MIRKIIKSISLILFMIGVLSCGSSVNNKGAGTTPDDTTQTDTTSDDTTLDDTTPTATETTVWSGSKDFNDSKWTINIQIGKENFTDLKAGDRIKISFINSTVATDYKKLQLDYMDSAWTELSGGTYTNGHKESGENSAGVVPELNPLIYTVSSNDVTKLKNYGLAIMGYGVVITKVTVITGSGNPEDDFENDPEPEPEKPVTPKPEPVEVTGTPFANHGALYVDGAYLKDKNDEKYMLYGMSTHGISWFSQYVNKDAFKTLRDDWNTNCIRLVLYPQQYNGYLSGGNKEDLKSIVCNGIDYATELGMYVLVDWHVHEYNPNNDLDEAKKFLGEIAAAYKNYDNILYEICNEPTGTPWTELKIYAESVIPVIRSQDSNAVIIVGTNTWSQDIHEVGNNRPADANGKKYDNIMYTFHFYANSHKQSFRDRVENCIKEGLPVFITEFGTCDASGNGGYNKDESQKWFDLCSTYNISHMNWSLCNKAETASAISSSCSKLSGWTESELTDSGKLVYNHFRSLKR